MPINAAQHPLRFGFDLDNTLINYEGACRRLCTDRGIKPTADENVRAALKRFCDTLPDGNAEWTRIQGWLYAEGLAFAEPFPGALECLRTLKGLGAHLYIVSHKSYFPALGSPKSLHTAATDWLKQYGIIDWAEGVFLEVSMADKLRRIAALNCLWFVDDLDVVLGAADFPKAVNRLQFCPDNNTLDKPWKVATSWKEITDTLDQAATEQLSKVRQLRIQTLEQPAHNPNDAVSTGLPLMPESVAAWLKDYSHGGFERIRQLGGAGNNSVYRVYFSDEPPLIVKFYKNTGNDQCERLDREWAFTSLIHSATDFAVPKPLIREHATGIAVFTSLKGRGIPTEQEVPVHYWEQCLKFLQQIQVVSGAIDNSPLPYAREALTSLQAYLGNLQKKRDYWLKQALEGTVDSESALWIQNDLEGMYQTVAEAIISHPSFTNRLKTL